MIYIFFYLMVQISFFGPLWSEAICILIFKVTYTANWTECRAASVVSRPT